MYDAWFSRPVPVSTGLSGDIRNLLSADQALDLLIHHWRDPGSQAHRSALRACRQAVSGGVSADVAREIFVEAARAARILIE
ncbi:DUF982 domain-containing protein [Mesorhizobium sp. PAMC28654]|uniref:DUF982 domain-containing protein n=1 Tax=Mesorhizobium sp. PAMC28654 TaxID=2880934 RepID=UPI001D0AECB7|nr:DUF982 domain-containing protein [Mesorhizobium sp. PAMC28654]UDL90486.1 DUF982 domain-containing protein [Mesorhizobium sp. PAMC28654]